MESVEQLKAGTTWELRKGSPYTIYYMNAVAVITLYTILEKIRDGHSPSLWIFETKSAAYSLFVTPVFFTFKMNKKTYHNISEKNSDVIYRSIDVIPP